MEVRSVQRGQEVYVAKADRIESFSRVLVCASPHFVIEGSTLTITDERGVWTYKILDGSTFDTIVAEFDSWWER